MLLIACVLTGGCVVLVAALIALYDRQARAWLLRDRDPGVAARRASERLSA